VERRQKNCVIGSYVAESVFEGQNPVGRVIKINGYSFTVVGVAAEKSGSVKGGQDDRIYLPYTVARTLTFMSRISNYTFSASDKDKLEEAIADIEEALFKVYQNDDFYSVTIVSAIVDTLDELTGTLTLILVGIAGISLLVGGIGIMNIMLVTVTERTKEIGIRKALGTRRRDILNQFIIEAATLSGIGGVFGIIAGVGLSKIVGSVASINAVPTPGAILLSFGISTAIGVGFGYLPAKRAAALNPIDALRFE